MFNIGRLCIKTKGRDSNLKAVIIDIVDDKYVLIDGQTRRKKCNISHLEPLDDILDIKKSASHEEVVQALNKKGIVCKAENPLKSKKTTKITEINENALNSST